MSMRILIPLFCFFSASAYAEIDTSACPTLEQIMRSAEDDPCEQIISAVETCYVGLGAQLDKLQKNSNRSYDNRNTNIRELEQVYKSQINLITYSFRPFIVNAGEGRACIYQAGRLDSLLKAMQKDLSKLKSSGF